MRAAGMGRPLSFQRECRVDASSYAWSDMSESEYGAGIQSEEETLRRQPSSKRSFKSGSSQRMGSVLQDGLGHSFHFGLCQDAVHIRESGFLVGVRDFHFSK